MLSLAVRTGDRAEQLKPRCYDRRMMLLDRERPEAMQNGQHA